MSLHLQFLIFQGLAYISPHYKEMEVLNPFNTSKTEVILINIFKFDFGLKTQHMSVTKVSLLILFRENVVVCCENYTNLINILFGQNAVLFNVKVDSTYKVTIFLYFSHRSIAIYSLLYRVSYLMISMSSSPAVFKKLNPSICDISMGVMM